MTALLTVLAELRREYQRMRAYWVNSLTRVALFSVGFLALVGVFDLLTESGYGPEGRLLSLVGFFVWAVADGSILRLTASLREDAQWGTLEQIALGGQLGAVLAGRTVAVLIYQIGLALPVAVVAVLLLKLNPAFSPGAVVLFVLTQVGVLGLALGIAGLALVYKSVSSVTLAVSTLLAFVTGALAPFDNAPALQAAVRLLPLAQGIELLRSSIVGGTPFGVIVGSVEFWGLVANSAFYLVVGLALFAWGQHAARVKGLLAHY